MSDSANLTKTEAQVFSLDGLIAWLERQNPRARYEYWCTQCLLGKFLTETVRPVIAMGAASVTFDDDERLVLPDGWNHIGAELPRTYGSALKRARKLLAYQS